MVVQVAVQAVGRAGAKGAQVAGRAGAATGRAALRTAARQGTRVTRDAARRGARAGTRAGTRASGAAARSGARAGARTPGSFPGKGVRSGGTKGQQQKGSLNRRDLQRRAGSRDRGDKHRGRDGGSRDQGQNQDGPSKVDGGAQAKQAAAKVRNGLRHALHPLQFLRRQGLKKATGGRLDRTKKRYRRGRPRVRRLIFVIILAWLLFGMVSSAPLFMFGAGGPDGTGGGGGGGVTSAGGTGVSEATVSQIAQKTGIPPNAVEAYVSAGLKFNVDWAILAGIGKLECNHGRSQLTGCPHGTANFCGARGPMQFLGNTWRKGTDSVPSGSCPGASHFTGNPIGDPIPQGQEGQGYATDGNCDGVADPWIFLDAAHAAARYLLAHHLRDDLDRAIRGYNNSSAYVNGVLEGAADYRAKAADVEIVGDGGCGGGAGGSGQYRLPLERRWYDEHRDWFTKPHHDYPAADIPVPEGTPVYAAASGEVITAPTTGKCGDGVMIRGDDGAEYIYCHGTDGGQIVRRGQHVNAGDLIMHSGNTGNSTGPHLHFGIRINDVDHCPQTFFTGIVEGRSVDVRTLPTSGCSN